MYNHILVAVNLDHYHDHDNHQAFGIARTLLSDGGRITALNVVEEISNYVTQYLPPNFSEEQVKVERAALEVLLSQEEDVTPVLVSGHAGRSIVDYAEHHGVDCIIIASHRPGALEFMIGSTASRVVRHAHCSVHVLR